MSDAANNERGNVTAFGSFSDNQLLDYPQASKYLGVSVSFLKKAKARGDIPFVPVGDLVRFRIASLNRWIQRKEVS
jgi:excisionase family DNA binding protein